MTEWAFVILLHMPGLCDTAACEARRGEIHAEVRGVDRTHCERFRKLIMDHFGKTRDGRPNIDGSVTECAPFN